MSTVVHPCWDRRSRDWRDHYARRIDRTLTPDEIAYGLQQVVAGCRSAVELKTRTDEQEVLDAEYRERAT
jgi:hypothetical protein